MLSLPGRAALPLSVTRWVTRFCRALVLPARSARGGHPHLWGLWLGACAATLLLGTRPASAEPARPLPSPLHLRDALSLARQSRAEIAAARARATAAAQVPRVVSALPDPMVMLSVDHLPIRLDGINGSLQFQQDFPLSGVLRARRRVAEAEASAVATEVGSVTLDVEQQVVASFLMVVEQQRMLALLEELTSLSQQTLSLSKARLQAGENSTGDVFRSQIEVARFDAEVKATQADLRAASAMLETALGQPVSGDAVLCELTTPTRAPPTLSELVGAASEARPELRAARTRISRASAGVDAMRSMYWPMAFLRFGGARTMQDGPGVMLMAGVSLPIWRDRLRAGVDEASAMQAMAEHEVRAMSRMIEGEVASSRETLAAAHVRWSTARERLVPLARRALSLMVASYAGGQVPLVSVLDALRSLREARMQEISAEVRLNLAWLKLGRATGKIEVGP